MSAAPFLPRKALAVALAGERPDPLLVEVRRRDGDNCRVCGRAVTWTGHMGLRRAEYDLLTSTPRSSDDVVVVCARPCSRRIERSIDPSFEPSRDDLRPAPASPQYGWETSALLDFAQTFAGIGAPLRLRDLTETEVGVSPEAEDGRGPVGEGQPQRVVEDLPGLPAPAFGDERHSGREETSLTREGAGVEQVDASGVVQFDSHEGLQVGEDVNVRRGDDSAQADEGAASAPDSVDGVIAAVEHATRRSTATAGVWLPGIRVTSLAATLLLNEIVRADWARTTNLAAGVNGGQAAPTGGDADGADVAPDVPKEPSPPAPAPAPAATPPSIVLSLGDQDFTAYVEALGAPSAANRSAVAEVRRRDGDTCRFCGRRVDWQARTGSLAGCYYHLYPGHRARAANEMVVACRACDQLHSTRVVLAPLLAVPERPFYGAATAKLLRSVQVATLDGVDLHDLVGETSGGEEVEPSSRLGGRELDPGTAAGTPFRPRVVPDGVDGTVGPVVGRQGAGAPVSGDAGELGVHLGPLGLGRDSWSQWVHPGVAADPDPVPLHAHTDLLMATAAPYGVDWSDQGAPEMHVMQAERLYSWWGSRLIFGDGTTPMSVLYRDGSHCRSCAAEVVVDGTGQWVFRTPAGAVQTVVSCIRCAATRRRVNSPFTTPRYSPWLAAQLELPADRA